MSGRDVEAGVGENVPPDRAPVGRSWQILRNWKTISSDEDSDDESSTKSDRSSTTSDFYLHQVITMIALRIPVRTMLKMTET